MNIHALRQLQVSHSRNSRGMRRFTGCCTVRPVVVLSTALVLFRFVITPVFQEDRGTTVLSSMISTTSPTSGATLLLRGIQ